MTWQNLLVACACGAFVLFLLLRMAPGPLGSVARRKIPGLPEAIRKVTEAQGDAAKAEALLAAGDLAAQGGAHVTTASGYYLRAMRLAPASLEPVNRLATLLRARPRALDRILWRRLAAIPWTGESKVVAARIAELLAARATRKRAERQVMTKLAATLRGLVEAALVDRYVLRSRRSGRRRDDDGRARRDGRRGRDGCRDARPHDGAR